MPMPAVLCEPQATVLEGLAALPESWIPTGVRFCYVAGPWGGCTGQVSRTPDSLEVRFQHLNCPTITCTDLKGGNVRVRIEGIASHAGILGVFHWAGDHAHFEDRASDHRADLYRSLDGKLVLEVRSSQKRPLRFHLLF